MRNLFLLFFPCVLDICFATNLMGTHEDRIEKIEKMVSRFFEITTAQGIEINDLQQVVASQQQEIVHLKSTVTILKQCQVNQGKDLLLLRSLLVKSNPVVNKNDQSNVSDKY